MRKYPPPPSLLSLIRVGLRLSDASLVTSSSEMSTDMESVSSKAKAR